MAALAYAAMGGYYDRLICLIVGLFWTGAGVLGFTTEWGGLQLFLISEDIAIEKLHGVGPVWIHWMKMIALPVAIIGLGNLVGAWLDSGSVLRLHSLVAARGTSRSRPPGCSRSWVSPRSSTRWQT